MASMKLRSVLRYMSVRFSIFEMALWFEALGRAFFRFFSSAKDFFADDALRGLLQIFIEGFFDCDEFRP